MKHLQQTLTAECLSCNNFPASISKVCIIELITHLGTLSARVARQSRDSEFSLKKEQRETNQRLRILLCHHRHQKHCQKQWPEGFTFSVESLVQCLGMWKAKALSNFDPRCEIWLKYIKSDVTTLCVFKLKSHIPFKSFFKLWIYEYFWPWCCTSTVIRSE